MALHTGSRPRSLRDEPNSLTTPATTEVGSDIGLTDRRGIRSGAPSVATRVITSSAMVEPLSAVPGPLDESVEDDPVVLMQLKTTIKDESETNVLSAVTSAHASFTGPNMALKDFGHELKATLDALAEIQARGISHVVKLPELVLVGDQSSGKSSLMSAIAGLSLPRSSGTCTRCPLHIRISKSWEWSCRVYIKQDYEFSPSNAEYPITIEDVTPKNKFPPWRRLPPHQQARHEFKTIQDRFDSDELETVLRCAQVAILNPGTPFSFFIPQLKGEAPEATRIQHTQRVQELADDPEAKFSPNTVALEVKGPDLADLNFYDLPGVFITAKRPEDKFMEQVVRNLTCDYISRPNAIILGAVPMNIDAENSFAFKLIRDLKAENRCVGVMTKADLLPHDTEAPKNWLSMLDEKEHRTGLGYFVTSRQEGNLEDQNKREEAFFNRTPNFDPQGSWPRIFERFRDRCGVETLKAFLSFKLGQEFSKVIPEIKTKVNKRIQHLEQQLEKYPDTPSNPEMEIMRALSQFSMTVKNRLQQQGFMRLWDQQAAEPLKKNILSLKPKFNVSEPSTRIVIDLSGPPSRKRQYTASESAQATPSKRPRGDYSSVKVEDLTPASSGTFPRSGSIVPFSLPSAQLVAPRSKDLLTIRNLMKDSARPGTPISFSVITYEPLYTESSKLWIRCIDLYIQQTVDLVDAEIMTILETSFQTLKTRAVYKESVEHIKDFIAKHEELLRSRLVLLHDLESSLLFTKDLGYLEQNTASEKRILERHRYHCRMAARNGVEVGKIPKMELMADDEIVKEALIMQKDLKTLGADPYDREVTVAALVRGYYITAARRFIDSASIHFMAGMLPEIAKQIEKYLDEKLGLTSGGVTKEVIARLVSEGDENAKKREELKGEKKRLDEALAIIENLKTQSATPRTVNGHVNAPGSDLSGLHQLHSRNGSAPQSYAQSVSQRSVTPSVTHAGGVA